MTNADITDMYDTDDIELPVPSDNSLRIQKSGMLVEVELHGKKFHAIDPAEFMKFESMVRDLRQKLLLTEQMVRQLQSQIRHRDQVIKSVQRELDTKVSHER